MPLFDLDAEVAAALKVLADRRLVSQDAFDELESHLWDEIEHQMTGGLEPQDAFGRATATFGAGAALLAEFERLYGNSKRAQLTNVFSYYFDRRFVMRMLFGTFCGAFFILGGLMLEGGNLHSIIGLTALLIVLGGATGALFTAYPIKTVKRAVALAMTGREASRSTYLESARVFRTLGDLALLSGGVGMVIGAIHVLHNLDKPDTIGPGVAVGLLTLLYSFLIKLFIGKPLADSFESRAAPSTDVATARDTSTWRPAS